jgi:hypothetical protein
MKHISFVDRPPMYFFFDQSKNIVEAEKKIMHRETQSIQKILQK